MVVSKFFFSPSSGVQLPLCGTCSHIWANQCFMWWEVLGICYSTASGV